MAKAPDQSICPSCNGLGSLFLADEKGRRVQVACGHSVCQGLREARMTKHVIAEMFRYLPPELTAKAKR